jgi:hypothetical protein
MLYLYPTTITDDVLDAMGESDEGVQATSTCRCSTRRIACSSG